MNKNTNAMYFFVVFLSMFIMMIVFMMLFIVRANVILVIAPIVLVAILILAAIKLSNGTLEQRGRLYTDCIECGKEIDTNSDYCKHCGASQHNTMICEYCGMENSKNDTVCKNCNGLLK